MKDKWLEWTWPKRIVLLLQGFLILLFLILYCTVGRQQVIWYEDEPLRYSVDGETATYSGKVDWQKAVFTVSPGPVVEYRYGDTLYGPYSIVYDPSAVPDEEDTPWNVTYPKNLVGVEVREGSQVLFRGAYLDTESGFLIFKESGEGSLSDISVVAYTTYEVISDPTPSVRNILRIAVAPEIVRRGHLSGFWLGVFCCVVCAVSLVYADELFRFHMAFRVRYPDDAEPSEWELFGRWVSWITLTILALVVFIMGLCVP